VVVDAESKKTNKTTLRSEWRGVQKEVCKKEKQALTQPALLEKYGFGVYQAFGILPDAPPSTHNPKRQLLIGCEASHFRP
jgi:hypothetical protein